MNAQDRYKSERYPDMTCFLALRNMEIKERKERRNRMKENWIYRRGDVYLANLDPYIGSEQGGTRPVLVLQNDDGNFYCSTLIVAPLSSKLKKLDLPTHVLLQRGRGLRLTSIVELEQIRTIDKQRILDYIGKLSHEQMEKVDHAIHVSLGLYIPEAVEAP